LLRHTLSATPSMRCVLQYAPSGREQELELALFGVGPALDAAAAQAVVLAVVGERALEPAARGLAQLAPTRGRLYPVAGPSGTLVLDDSYNANPASMRASIATALELSRARGGRTVLVLGDMRELGDASRREHEAVGEQAAVAGVAALFACGLEMTRAAASARDKARREGLELSIAHLADPTGAADLVRPLLRAGDVVLVKGSRSLGMERVVDGLLASAGGEP
jgi:UDP-N-acetylmuramoyl-tripeptide--D-alanyl-D-alanine ligase